MLAGLRCNGTEPLISACGEVQGEGVPAQCTHSADVYLICSNSPAAGVTSHVPPWYLRPHTDSRLTLYRLEHAMCPSACISADGRELVPLAKACPIREVKYSAPMLMSEAESFSDLSRGQALRHDYACDVRLVGEVMM